MGSDSIQHRSASVDNFSFGEVEAESNNVDSLEAVSSGGDTTRQLENAAEVLTRVELDLACSSEKLVNLDILVMHVASRENDFEAFALDAAEGSVQKALEFDLLYGILDSEVKELESFLSALQTEIASFKGFISSIKHLGDGFKEMEEKLQDCEDSLKLSFEQVSDIKVQSANFRKILLASSGDEKRRDGKELDGLEDGGVSDSNAKIKMQTAEQQRNILRMLEKSLAREMDLEKKLTESRQIEEDLKLRIQQEVLCMEEEAEGLWGRLFEGENSAEILLGISRELFGRIQMAQFSINGSIQREEELNSKIQDLQEQLKEKDFTLQGSENSNVKLKEDLSLLQVSIDDANTRVEQLEKQLKDSELKRLHAVASAEASQEKQIMLDCTIRDMENLIKDLKSRVLKAESLTESAEDKCILLSETNAELIEEVNFLKRRMEHLEASLHQADEAKKETAKDIRMHAKLIADLVVELALERECLHKQISSLVKHKKAAVKFLQQIKDPSVSVIGSRDGKEVTPADIDHKNGTSRKESNEEIMESAATNYENGNETGVSSTTEIKSEHDDSAFNFDTVRNIDARQLKNKYIFMVILALVIPTFVAFLLQPSVGLS